MIYNLKTLIAFAIEHKFVVNYCGIQSAIVENVHITLPISKENLLRGINK